MKKLAAIFTVLFLCFACDKDELPEVETLDVIAIDGLTVELGGIVHSEGGTGGQVHRRGIVWNAGSARPTVDKHDGMSTSGVGAGDFSVVIIVPSAGEYSFRAFATNQRGTVYGSRKTFTAVE